MKMIKLEISQSVHVKTMETQWRKPYKYEVCDSVFTVQMKKANADVHG